MVECDSYSCALNKVKFDTTIAPCYVTLGGLKENEGGIVTKNRVGYENVEELNEEKWFIIQTN